MSVPVTSTGFVTPLIVSSPRATHVLAVEIDVARGEAELGMALGVEEVGRLQVGRQVLVLDVDARRPWPRPRGSPRIVVDDQLGLDLAELALERADEVLDLEADRGVDRVELPGAGQRAANFSR